MHPTVAAALAALWGVGAGWVSTWIAHRYQEGTDADGYEVAVLGDATCPTCDHVVTLAEAAPLRSISCSSCGSRLPVSWNLVPLAVLGASLGMWATFRGGAVLWPFLWLVPVLVVAATIDIRTFLIPKRVVWVGFAVGAALMAAVAVGMGHPETLRSAAIGAVGYFAVLFVANLVNPAGMGFGDVRLSVVLGLYLGWIDLRLPLYGLLLACVLGIGFGVAKRLRATTPEERAFPFGPGLAGGTLVAVWAYTVLVPPL